MITRWLLGVSTKVGLGSFGICILNFQQAVSRNMELASPGDCGGLAESSVSSSPGQKPTAVLT